MYHSLVVLTDLPICVFSGEWKYRSYHWQKYSVSNIAWWNIEEARYFIQYVWICLHWRTEFEDYRYSSKIALSFGCSSQVLFSPQLFLGSSLLVLTCLPLVPAMSLYCPSLVLESPRLSFKSQCIHFVVFAKSFLQQKSLRKTYKWLENGPPHP